MHTINLLIRGVSVLIALSILVLLSTLFSTPSTYTPPVTIEIPAEVATTSVDSVTNISAPETTSSAEEVVIPQAPTVSPTVTTIIPEVIPEISVTVPETNPLGAVNALTRAATVNILCLTTLSSPVNPITGTGVVIDPRGIILTNAHVAQFFLLKDYPAKESIDCVIRTGSPARNTYRAELLYLPPQWISDNRTAIRLEHPTGTGENDYAFLRITGTAQNEAVTEALPFVPIGDVTGMPEVGTPILIASYPAGFLGGATILKDLFLSSALSEIKHVFTFVSTTPDLISTGGTVVAQSGSSGSPVVGGDGRLIGLVVTSTAGATTDERDLRALTVSHINRSLTQYVGNDIATFLSASPAETASFFNTNIAPALTNILVDELKK